ncbi:hypothetical protein KXX21_005123 [Aspergillus fumigatus]|nr:hypothetical protein KXX21_005123 [Aspergillus fumigatus]
MPPTSGDRPANPDILIVEAWGQGFMVGSLILMIAITVANMKSGVFLHKMTVAEVTDVMLTSGSADVELGTPGGILPPTFSYTPFGEGTAAL